MTNEMKKKIAILVIGILLALVIGGTLIWIMVSRDAGKAKTPEPNKSEKVSKENEKTENDSKVYINTCDSLDTLEQQRSVYLVTDEGKFVQGTGAFCNAETADVFANVKFKEAVDISEFKAGYVHLSYYVSTLNNFTQNLFFEISSSGTCDKDELGWEIPLSSVKEGWNEVYLSVTDAVTTGKINLMEVNYLRFYSPSLKRGTDSIDIIIDDIYATRSTDGSTALGGITASGGTEIVEDAYQETKSKDGVTIASCNTVNIFSQMKGLQVTTQSGQYVEGSGAMKIVDGTTGTFMLKEPVDISKYMTQQGKVHVSLYISDASKLAGSVGIYLSNAETREEAMMFWVIDQREFQTGWNHLSLDIYSSWMQRPIKADEVRYFSCSIGKPKGEVTLILDNIYVSDH